VLTSCSGGAASYCGPLTIEPAQPALAILGIIGECAGFCSEYPGFQWVLSQSPSDCICYGDLAGLKVTLNYSSTDYIIDYYDFESHPTTSSTSVATKKSATTSSRSASSLATKSISKSSSHTMSKIISTSSHSTSTPTTKSSSKSSSQATSKTTTKFVSTTEETYSTKTSSKATSSKSTLHTSTSTSKTSSSKSLTHSTTKSA
jgi:hypothetical protein